MPAVAPQAGTAFAAAPPHRPPGPNTVASRPGGGEAAGRADVYDPNAGPDALDGEDSGEDEEVPTGPDAPAPLYSTHKPLTAEQEAKRAKLEQLGIRPNM